MPLGVLTTSRDVAPLAPRVSGETSARIETQPWTRRDEALEKLPGQLGFASGAELIAALERVFGCAHAETAKPPGVGAGRAQPGYRHAAGRVGNVHGDPADFPPAAPDSEVIIRTALNRRYGATHILDPEARRRELAERETLSSSLNRLYRISVAHTPAALRPPVRESDIERAATVIRRLSLIRQLPLEALAAFCETEAAEESDLLANLGDAFQLRHLLAFHQAPTREVLDALEIYRLEAACENRDAAAVRAWFDLAASKKDCLPKDTSSFLKHLMLRQWRAGNLGLETLAFELAIFDVRLFGIIGWENARTFYSVLKRIGRKACSTFDGYLIAGEIEEAIGVFETAENMEQLAHFCTLRARHDARTLLDLERTVFATAEQREKSGLVPSTTNQVPPGFSDDRRASSILRLFQSAPSPA